MASYSIAPATITVFLPLIGNNRQNYIIRMDALWMRSKARTATEAALLEDIHRAVHERELVDILREKVKEPYTDSVTVVFFRARKEDTLQVTGHEYAFTFKSLLVSWGKIVGSLNEGLGRNFRVYSEDKDDEIVLVLEFRPKPIMNPEDEEEVIEVPMRPRATSIASE